MIDQLEKEIHEGMLDLYQHQSMSSERESIVYFYFSGIHNENITLKEEIKRLKEEYMILQNASDEVEEEKDREIERLNNILDTLMQDMALLNATSKKEIKPKYVFDRIATLRGVDKEWN